MTKLCRAIVILVVGFVVSQVADPAHGQSRRPVTGVLRVDIDGPTAVRNAAAWRVNAPGQPNVRKSGLMVALPAGSYTVTFTDVDDFVTPSPMTVTIVGSRSTAVRGVYRPGRPKALTAVYEPGSTYTRCFPTQVVLATNYPVPDDYTGSDGAYFEKTFPVALTASGKIDASAAIAGMREELKRREAGFGCDVTQPTPSSSCRLSAESFAKARRMYIDNPGNPGGVFWNPTGPFSQGWVKGEKHTLSVIADDKISSTGVVLEWVNELRSYDLVSMDQDSWGDFSKIDVCGPDGFPQSKAGSYSILTLAGQGVTRGSTTPTKYISVDQQMLRYFFTPIYVKSIYEMVDSPNGWDMAAYLNEQKVCAPLTGEFVPWRINEPKDVTNLINYSMQKPNSTNCNLGMEFVSPRTFFYDIAAPIAVQQMKGIVEGLIAVPNSNTKPSLRPLSLETNPIKFFVKTSTSGGSPTPVAPTATFTPTPVPPTATFTPTPVAPTATFTPTPVPPTATFTPTPVPPTATFTPTKLPNSFPSIQLNGSDGVPLTKNVPGRFYFKVMDDGRPSQKLSIQYKIMNSRMVEVTPDVASIISSSQPAADRVVSGVYQSVYVTINASQAGSYYLVALLSDGDLTTPHQVFFDVREAATPTPTFTFTPFPSCTPVRCGEAENLVCNSPDGCSNGCGYTCVATVAPIINTPIIRPFPSNYLTPNPLVVTTPNPLVRPSLGTPAVGPVLGLPPLGPIQGIGTPFLNATPPSFVGTVAPFPSGTILRPSLSPTPFPSMGPIMGPMP
jgi:hypothetical protein